jgi:hypothetical protein
MLVLLVLLIYLNTSKEPFQNPADSSAHIHYFWIVSEKRKVKMLEQLNQRRPHPSVKTPLTTSMIRFVPGIFDDNVENTEHPNLPKTWLAFPVVRLLAAHMKALRQFKKDVDANGEADKSKHVFVCLEDDVVLRDNFEDIVEESAATLRNTSEPTRIALGYLSEPVHKTPVRTSNSVKISQLHQQSGDPWGTQCYMMNYSYVEMALKKYEQAYMNSSIVPDKSNPNAWASDVFMFEIPNSQHLIVEPPACIEDNPTFGSMLGHDWNRELYDKLIQVYDRARYFLFGDSK